MPIEAVEGYRFPLEGTARLYRPGQEPEEEEPEEEQANYFECHYTFDRNFGTLNFTTGWTDFTAAVDLGWAALLLIKIAPMQDYLCLSFVEVNNFQQ